jgi:hypothetical protein
MGSSIERKSHRILAAKEARSLLQAPSFLILVNHPGPPRVAGLVSCTRGDYFNNHQRNGLMKKLLITLAAGLFAAATLAASHAGAPMAGASAAKAGASGAKAAAAKPAASAASAAKK